MKSSKKQLLKYGTLVVASLILLPMFPLVWGIYFAIKFFRENRKKLAFGTLIASLVLTGVVISKFPSPSKPSEELSTQSNQIESNIDQESTPIPSNRTGAKVIKVVDGDTMDFSIDGKTERIRVVGINTPETVDPRTIVECFGIEASNKAKEILKVGMDLELEADPTQGERDKYQRLLRYVWVNNEDYGKKMIADGYSYEYTYNTPYKYQTEYKQAQKDAEAGKKGLWADNACVATPNPGTPKPTTTKPVATTTTFGPSSTYTGINSCSGPDLDCSDFSTHAEAQSFFNSCGFTATNDPMKLDSVGVGDGVACESLP